MGNLVAWIKGSAFALGAPGLLLVTFVDSSVLSLPELADILIVLMVARDKARLPLYVLCATVGSLAGCLVIYYIGRKGGEALVRRRFQGPSVDRTMGALRRHGMLAVLVPAILPPPMPFKIFVFLAGVADITPLRFSTAILIGRGGRYLILGLLAVAYGDQAMTYVREHGIAASLAAVGLLVVAAVAYIGWSQAQAAKARRNPVS